VNLSDFIAKNLTYYFTIVNKISAIEARLAGVALCGSLTTAIG
jgi:hypothetical protein